MIRRDFLKLCLATAHALLVQPVTLLSSFAREVGIGRHVSRHTRKPLKGIPSICRLCPARCGIVGYLEGDQLVKIGGNLKHPNSLGKLCARGLAGVNMAYDPDRITHPMMRRGDRGKGQWERISWEKAYSELASRLKSIYQSGKPGDLIFHSGYKAEGIVKHFLNAFGKAVAIDDETMNQGNGDFARRLMWGEAKGVPDIANAHYVLNFGSNFYETDEFYTGFVKRFMEARFQTKAKLVTFDVRLSHTAGNSDEWFPITPGTDGVVALAMAHVILRENLYDQEFVRRWLNVPVSLLSRHLSAYPPEVAEKASGIAASDIERVAREFAVFRPSVAISGRGVTAHYNGTNNERCVFLLNALVGSIDTAGGFCLPRMYRLDETDWQTEARYPGRLEPRLTPHGFITLVKERKLTTQLYFVYEANPAYTNPQNVLTSEVLRDEKLIPYIVVADCYLTETAKFADLVLPASTYLESWGIDSPPSLDLVPFVALQQPIVRPFSKSVPFSEVLIELSRRLGPNFRRSFGFETTEGYITSTIERIKPLKEAGGIEYLKENGVWYEKESEPSYRSYVSKGFRTASGKIEVFSGALKKKGFNPYPSYEPIPGHQDLKGKFVLVTYESNVMGERTANLKWLAEIKHRNVLWINRDVAKVLHIEDGDRVRVSSRYGTIFVEARLTFGIHPRTVALERNLGHSGYGHVAQAKKFKSKDPNTNLLWWEKEGNGISPNAIIIGQIDPVGGGEAWNDTLVVISKA